MKVLDAIKSTVARYPLEENAFERVLIDRGLDATADYGGTTKEFELATADIYMVLATSSSISESGYKVDPGDQKRFRKMANAIYRKYNDPKDTSLKVPRGRSNNSW